jgi:5-methylcytosine-specific restriction endonuclease McrA
MKIDLREWLPRRGGNVQMRLCSGAGCGRAIKDDAKFCDECKAERGISPDVSRQHTTGYDATLDGLRKGTRWQRLRAKIAKKFPFCARCLVSVTEIIDHIVPAAVAIMQAQASGRYPCDKYAGYYIPSNLQGLCRSCHGVKTIEDKIHVGPWPDVVAKEQAQPKKVWSF